MRRAVVTMALVAMLAACGDDTAADPSATTADRPATTDGPVETTRPAIEPADECAEVTIEPGAQGVAWLASTDDPWGFGVLPTAVDGGFLIGTMECVTVVDVNGTLRWSRLTDHVLAGAQVGDRIVVLTTPIRPGGPIVTAYDAATGTTLWDDTTTAGVWQSLITLGDVVVLTGAGDGTLVATLDAETGQVLDTWRGRSGISSVSPFRHHDRVILGATDGLQGRLLTVDPTGSLVLDHPVVPRYPVPIAGAGDTVVVQASGIDDDTDDVEPVTFLAAHDLASGTERWRLTVDGTHAERAVAAGDVVVMSTSAGVTAVEVASGVVRWSVPSTFERPATLTPVGDDAVAVASAGGVVQLLEVVDGGLRWEQPVGVATRLEATAGGDLLVADDGGRYLLLDGEDGTELWSATGPVPTIRDTPPNQHQMVESDGTHATIGCLRALERCERTDQRIVAVRPLRR
jgi:outer membrane protein assembly factor BamB